MIEKINDMSGVNAVGGVKSKRAGLYGAEGVASGQDDLAVSNFAREMAAISAEMAKVPEVRENKIQDLKRQIDEGTYNPDLASLAARLVWAGINKVEG